MLVQMWSNWNSHAFLTGEWNGITVLENWLVVSYECSHILTLRLCNSILTKLLFLLNYLRVRKTNAHLEKETQFLFFMEIKVRLIGQFFWDLHRYTVYAVMLIGSPSCPSSFVLCTLTPRFFDIHIKRMFLIWSLYSLSYLMPVLRLPKELWIWALKLSSSFSVTTVV